MSTTKKDSAQETNTPLGVILQQNGFINVTGLREYIWFIPTRTVGKGLLYEHVSSYAFIGLPTYEIIEEDNNHYRRKVWSTPINEAEVYLLIVTNDGMIWLGRTCVNVIGGPGDTGRLEQIDVRLCEYADRSNDPSFIRIVRPRRLRHGDLLKQFALIAPKRDQNR